MTRELARTPRRQSSPKDAPGPIVTRSPGVSAAAPSASGGISSFSDDRRRGTLGAPGPNTSPGRGRTHSQLPLRRMKSADDGDPVATTSVSGSNWMVRTMARIFQSVPSGKLQKRGCVLTKVWSR